MPELPEVETMRRGVLAIVGATIVNAERTPCSKRPIVIKPRIDRLNKRVQGKTITSVDRLGKRVVIRLNSDDRLIFEPRMTGLVLIADPPTQEHLRFCLQLKKCPVKKVLFWDRRGLGNVTLLSADEYKIKLTDGKLGPDALAISSAEFPKRFKGTQREIKIAMLDQKIVLGIGNLYAAEILHLAGVHPQTRCDQITGKRWQLIYQRMIEVFELAIEYEGSTLSDGTYRNAINGEGSFQNEHRVYDREGQACPKCKNAKIIRIVQAQRATFFCKSCQTKR
ncbi:MAG: bifunctional DNA-formamidopyrimidine glycosylase/DNA-(apurinic or apyrimidinic site) lyase [Mariniblastus sp.]|nr:bifunctional DNA-formamidopyrimidine glycosylase/DNA-(apurinic or apyrimidinic site) lyase [Mariniblastus sp.]